MVLRDFGRQCTGPKHRQEKLPSPCATSATNALPKSFKQFPGVCGHRGMTGRDTIRGVRKHAWNNFPGCCGYGIKAGTSRG
eukprot:16351137-Heterocapsa_arctica.AAC.1